jgi:two-component system sensor histidine kinase BaeS
VKTLFSKIFFAQVITVGLALLVIALLTRVSLRQGFAEYLERQESTALKTLAPAIADLHDLRGSWDFLVDDPRAWERIWRQARSNSGEAVGPRGVQRRGPPPREQPPRLGGDFGPAEARLLRWMRSLDRPSFRERLFLLDQQHNQIVGATYSPAQEVYLEPLESGGEIVGWIGFTPMGKVLPPEARRFLQGQVRLLGIALVIALGLAALLGYLLARHLSLPVKALSGTVAELSAGRYGVRAAMVSADEIGRLGQNVNRLAESLEKNRSARQRWMADVAHELRTPIAILKGEVESLADGVRIADERMTASLREEIDQLADLVDDLQALAQSDAGALDLHKETVDLRDLAQQLTDTFRHRMSEREIELELDAPPRLEMKGDPRRLRQLFNNLLENSCRYVHSGGRVRVVLSSDGSWASVRLADSGPGVSNDQLGQLFERFYRIAGSRSRATGGSGLGLSICRNIVEAHGGEIRAGHSEMGGLEIQISLPLS